MPAQTFTLNNNTNANIQVLKIVFDVEPGLTFTADLTNFGGSSSFQSPLFEPSNVQQATITAQGSKTLDVDYQGVSGQTGQRRSNILVWATGNLTSSVKNLITIQAP